MNITLNIPAASFERLLTALERVATAAERLAGPPEEPYILKPHPPEFWGFSSNANSLQIEEEDRREALGYGSEYQANLESVLSAANRIRNLADANGQGPAKGTGQS